MKFTISSHENYIGHTRKVLEPSLLEAGVPKEDIYWFVYSSQVKDYTPITDNYWLVAHNSIDFTGLVSVLELELEHPWWFLLHDTTRVGPNFYNYLMSLELNGETIPISKHGIHPGGNMGLYSWRYLTSNSSTVLKYKNDNPDPHAFKTRLVHDEDALFKEACMVLNKQRPVYGPPEDRYGTGMPRLQEHFQELDLYKIKANWRGFVDKWNVTP